MNIQRKNIISKLIAILAIIMLTTSDFLFVGKSFITYAVDVIQTNTANVDFSSYFLNSEGEKVDRLDLGIAEVKNLYVEVSVKNEGYFNGKISLKNNNFEFTDNNEENEKIGKITSTEVELKQINAGSTETIELEVKPIISEELKRENLTTKTQVNMEGEYVNSKNIEKNRRVSVEGKAEVELNVVSSNEITAELTTRLLNNALYNVDGEERRVMQILVNSKVVNDSYPIKNTNITLTAPTGVVNCSVLARKLTGTNSKNIFNENNYEYNVNTQTLTISINNEEETIDFVKEGEDEFVVTYILEKEANVIDSEIEVKSKIHTYDEKELEATQNVHIEEVIDEEVSYSISTIESLYKGKIYIGEEKEYETTTEINVNYADAVNEIKVIEENPKYIAGEREINANVIYKNSLINKEEIVDLLGEEGTITITNQNGTIISNINKDSEADENGNIVINYPELTNSIVITTSKPISEGSLKVHNTKAIESESLSREEINNINAIKEVIKGTVNSNEYSIETVKNIELLNTESLATLTLNTNSLTALEKNENVKITIALANNNEKYDLYKNPTIKVELPEQVTDIDAKCKLIYGNGLTIKNAKIEEEDSHKVIAINLEGQQEIYNTEAIEGTTIIIDSTITVDKLAATSEENIVLNCSNEIATSLENINNINAKVNIEGNVGLIAVSGIEELDIEELGKADKKDATVSLKDTRRELTVNIEIINNEAQDIHDLKILGKLPTKSTDNLAVRLASELSINEELTGIKVYYTDIENPTNSIEEATNGWREASNISADKYYLITIDTLRVKERIIGSYKVTLPEEMDYDQSATIGYKASYSMENNKNEKDSTEIKLTTGAGPHIDMSVNAVVGNETIGKESDTIEESGNATSGEIITYEVTLTNNGTEDAKDVTFKEIVPEGAIALRAVKGELTIESEVDPITAYKSAHFIETESKELETTIDQLKIGESRKYALFVRATPQSETITNKFIIQYKEKEISKFVTTKVTTSNIKVDLEADYYAETSNYLESGREYEYKLKVASENNATIANAEIQLNVNELFDISYIEYNDSVTGEYKKLTGNDAKKFNLENINKEQLLNIYVIAKQPTGENKKAEIHANVSSENNNIRTIKFEKEVRTRNVFVTIEATNFGENVKEGQEIEYTINIQNNQDSVDFRGLKIADELSDLLELQEIKINDTVLSEENYIILEKQEGKTINIITDLNAGENAKVSIKTKVHEDIRNAEMEEITNNVQLIYREEVIDTSDKVVHILEPATEIIEEDDESDEENENYEEDDEIEENEENEEVEKPATLEGDSDESNTNNTENEDTNTSDKNDEVNSNPQEKTYTISGTVWNDENENGQRDNGEKTVSNVEVQLLNASTGELVKGSNGQILGQKTDKNGFYSFTNLPNGKYMVIFKYDTEKYLLTAYQADGVQAERNSDAENINIKVDGVELRAGVTDTIEIKDASKANIDLGVIDSKVFDLELTKTVSKITVVNNNENRTVEFNDQTMAKVEVDAKYLKDTTVVIEYKIKVTNKGELAGYAKKIVDYKPTDLTFNSSLNNKWYQTGNYVYSNELADTKIEPGETKELTLILTKKMTETNTGLVNNVAEIATHYNKLNLEDVDSIPNNKEASEDDTGNANVIISVKTGAAISYISLTLSIIAIMTVSVVLVGKKILKEDIQI